VEEEVSQNAILGLRCFNLLLIPLATSAPPGSSPCPHLQTWSHKRSGLTGWFVV